MVGCGLWANCGWLGVAGGGGGGGGEARNSEKQGNKDNTR